MFLELLLYVLLALLPGLVICGAGVAAWLMLPRQACVAAILLLGAILLLSIRWQWWWLRAVVVRYSLTSKLRRIGLTNSVGETPRVLSVRWRRNVTSIRFSTTGGHAYGQFAASRSELMAVFGGVDVDVSQGKRCVVIDVIRRSAFQVDQPQSW
ncbi:hypothetical protein [Nocardioides sp. R-C-SC26]|uniref:hypothetical protein n=1 Tax=Nocardioides sp. R-C-SC26 TaxID=2870414 RepID=UPI001E5109BB|nr:hypothetical protein [Nocardioides sp. R-C-SC26]